jgi:beta-lactamase class A
MSTKIAAHAHGHAGWQLGWLRGIHVWLEHHRHLFRVAARVVMIVLGAVALLQFVYPVDRALPFTKVGGVGVGLQDRQAIASQLSNFAQQNEVTIKTPSKTWQTAWQSIGLTIDQQASIDAAVQYEWWERLLPFSSVMRVVQSQTMPLVALVDKDRLQYFAEQVSAEDKQAASNATISVVDGQVNIDMAKNGYKYKASELQRQIQATPMIAGTTVELVPDTVPPVRSEAALQALAEQAEHMLSKQVTLQAAGKTYQPSRAELGAWIVFNEDADTKELHVAINKDALKTYLEQIDKDIKIEPGTSTVTLLDGLEISRTPADAGQTVAVDEAFSTIESALRSSDQPHPIELQLAQVPPKVEYVRTYSKASSGLQALLRDWEASRYGDYGLIVRELTGEQRYADWQPDKPFVTASTYKMFLAYTVFTKMDQGVITGGQKTDIGWTVDACIEEMIINSTNHCAISLQNLVGWGEVDRMIHDAGFYSTMLNNQFGGEKYSTVRDETNFLLRVQAHSLMSANHSDYLLGLLKRQVWRGGIPSGVPPGTVVADKVGFYNGWVHDVAIVYSPKATYMLGIMSKGGSDPQFADLSRRVYNFFNN